MLIYQHMQNSTQQFFKCSGTILYIYYIKFWVAHHFWVPIAGKWTIYALGLYMQHEVLGLIAAV